MAYATLSFQGLFGLAVSYAIYSTLLLLSSAHSLPLSLHIPIFQPPSLLFSHSPPVGGTFCTYLVPVWLTVFLNCP